MQSSRNTATHQDCVRAIQFRQPHRHTFPERKRTKIEAYPSLQLHGFGNGKNSPRQLQFNEAFADGSIISSRFLEKLSFVQKNQDTQTIQIRQKYCDPSRFSDARPFFG
jgi:hypothetical protein